MEKRVGEVAVQLIATNVVAVPWSTDVLKSLNAFSCVQFNSHGVMNVSHSVSRDC